jgi:uncharacterized membrane protein YfcA
MFQVYLPVAEISVNLLVMLGLGAAVGFLSGMFGVGGGFLLTPLLMFSGIPPAIAVATGANQIVASSVSGALAQWRRGNIDFRMGVVLIVGGVAGAFAGVLLVGVLHRLGHADVFISLVYVIFLGMIGSLMLAESLRAVWRTRAGKPATMRKPGDHTWIHGLPLKMRFQRSRLYISAIPALILGAIVGLLAAVLGAGGGFIIVPAMIYLLGMPTMSSGTSLFQIIFRHRRRHRPLCGAESDSRHSACSSARNRRGDRRPVRRQCRSEAAGRAAQAAARRYRARRGAQAAGRPAGDPRRSLQSFASGGDHDAARGFPISRGINAPAGLHPVAAEAPRPEQVQSDISTREITIESNFTGIEIVLFGSVDFSRAPSPDEGPTTSS